MTQPITTVLETYMDFLKVEGYKPTAENDEITFKREGIIYFLRANEEDSLYYRLMLPAVYTKAGYTQQDLVDALTVANKVSGAFRVAKVFVSTDDNTKFMNVVIVTELLLKELDDFKNIFEQTCDICRIAARNFYDEIQGLQEANGDS